MLCIDASTMVEALIERGDAGAWARGILSDAQLVAPELLLAEVANLFRRLEARRVLPRVSAEQSFERLRELPVRTIRFAPCATRIWQLRHNLTAYDAWYVTVAELHDVPLVTLDRRLASAHGPNCEFLTPN